MDINNFKLPNELLGQLGGLMNQTIDKAKEVNTSKKWNLARFTNFEQFRFFIENNQFTSVQVFFFEGNLCLLYN